MFRKLSQFFDELTTPSISAKGEDIDQSLAIAALLVETANTTDGIAESEIHVIERLLQKLFDVKPSEIQALIEKAKLSTEQAVCLYRYTSVVKQAPIELRNQVILALWKVSYADGVLDPHEEATIRKVADLLYVSHSDFVRNKILAQEFMGLA